MEQNGGAHKRHRTTSEDDVANGKKPVCEMSDDDDDDDDDLGDEKESVDDNQQFFFDLRKAQLELAKLSCSIGQPLGTCPRFQRVMKCINPSFTVEPLQFAKDLVGAFKEERSRVKKMLASLNSQICLSVDLLLDRSGFQYICLAAHFIDDKWKLKKWVLKFCGIEAFSKGLKAWEIEGKIFSLTLAGSHVDEYVLETVKSGVQKKKNLELNGMLFSVNCCAQTFNLMAEDLYKEISGIIRKMQELVSLKGPPFWYLPALRLKQGLYSESIGEMPAQGSTDDIPTPEEWEKARCVSKLVLSARKFAKALFETKYPTANIFLHKLQELHATLYHECNSADDFNSKMARKMLERLDKYWNEVSLTLAIACVLDPRCKMRYIEYISSKGEISGNKLDPSVILDAIRSLYGEYVISEGKRKCPVTYATSSDSEDEDEDEDEAPRKVEEEELCDSVLLQEYNQFTESIDQPPKSDLERYLEDPVVPWSKDFNALRWWRVEGPKYPILSKMARDILAIPMSVATSYDAYYVVREADPWIMKTGPDFMRNIFMCTRSWKEESKGFF